MSVHSASCARRKQAANTAGRKNSITSFDALARLTVAESVTRIVTSRTRPPSVTSPKRSPARQVTTAQSPTSPHVARRTTSAVWLACGPTAAAIVSAALATSNIAVACARRRGSARSISATSAVTDTASRALDVSPSSPARPGRQSPLSVRHRPSARHAPAAPISVYRTPDGAVATERREPVPRGRVRIEPPTKRSHRCR